MRGLGPLGARMVVVLGGGLAAGQDLGGRHEAALELIVVVAVEQVVLAVVLVVDHGLDVARAARRSASRSGVPAALAP